MAIVALRGFDFVKVTKSTVRLRSLNSLKLSMPKLKRLSRQNQRRFHDGLKTIVGVGAPDRKS